MSVLCLWPSILSSIPSVHGGASSGAVHQPTHQLVCEVQQEEGQGEGWGTWEGWGRGEGGGAGVRCGVGVRGGAGVRGAGGAGLRGGPGVRGLLADVYLFVYCLLLCLYAG